MTDIATIRQQEQKKASSPPLVTSVLMAAVLLVVSHMYITIPLVPTVADEYSATMSAAAWIGTGFGLAFAVGNLIFPTLSDHIDPRRLMAGGLVAVTIAGVVAGSAPSLEILIAARVVQGFVAPALPPVALAYLPRVLPERARPRAIAVLSTAFLLAGIVGQAWSLLIGHFGWRWVLWGLAPLLLAAVVPVLRLPAAPSVETGSSVLQALRTLAGMLRRPLILVAYSGAITILFAFVGMYTALQAASSQFGASDPVTGFLLRLPGVPGIVLGLFAGAFIGRWGASRVGSASFALAALGLVVEALGGPLWLTLFGSTVFVAGLAVSVPAAVVLVGMGSAPARGAGMAGYAFLIGVGAALGPVLASALAPAGFASTVLVIAALLVIPAITFALSARLTTRG
jgi:predicted MFS family arabinose efflux permease